METHLKIQYKEVMNDDPDYFWYDDVTYVVVEDPEKATVKSAECDKIIPDWVPDNSVLGVPNLQELLYRPYIHRAERRPDMVSWQCCKWI